ncbi:MAG: extensin family protein [Rhizobiaceae bacterium]|nr:extensin family protein [Rhizobiaceae bacterium]
MLFRIIAVTGCLISLTAAALPENGPLPQAKPDAGQSQAPIEETPIPTPKPDNEQTQSPIPEQKPAVSQAQSTGDNEPGEKQGPPKPPLTIAAETDEVHQACVKDLTAMGAVFKEIPRIDDGNGCGIDKPISVSVVLPGIKLKPEGTMRCETALTLAHWMKESVIPTAQTALGEDGQITAINQASTYICRSRNSVPGAKISEHARGNAVDVAGFTFENGKSVSIEPRNEDSTLTGAFQRTASASACLYFTTVLDPNSDAAHETHFHLDVLKRNGGFRYCH